MGAKGIMGVMGIMGNLGIMRIMGTMGTLRLSEGRGCLQAMPSGSNEKTAKQD